MKPSSRRDFLKTSTATGAILAGLSLSNPVHAQGREEIKIGMLGCGGRNGGAAMEAMNSDPSVKLVAMMDVFETRVRAQRNALRQAKPEQVQVPDEHCFWDLDGYKKVIELSDVVLIACASNFHPLYTEAAIQAGKHVFVEKPHAIDPPGIRRIEAACKMAKDKGISIVSGLQSRQSWALQDIIKRIHDGEIGEIVAMQSMFLRPPYGLVSRRPGMAELQYQFSNWYNFLWLCGDDVTQSLVHNVDRMTWALQGELPDWAFATAGRSGSFGEVHGDRFDHASVVYEYKSGVRLYAMCRTTNNCYNNYSDIVMGSKATAHLDVNNAGQNRFVKRNGEEIYRYEGPRNNPYQTTHDELIRAVKSGEPMNDGGFMCSSTMVAILGQVVAFQGNAVTYNEAYNANFVYGGVKPEDVTMDMEPPTLPDGTGNYPIPIPGQTRFIG